MQMKRRLAGLPSGKRLHNYGKSPFLYNGKIHYKWPFSIAMLNYQRVTPVKTGYQMMGTFYRLPKAM
jgi:hypothetical protein